MHVSSILCATGLVLLCSVGTALADHGKNFHCNGFPFTSAPAKQAMDRLAHNNAMRKIVSFYAWAWENEEMRRVCDAGAEGTSVNTSCFEGRRDWDAIANLIPEGLSGKSNTELRPHMLDLDAKGFHTIHRKEAMQYCADLGVVDSVFQ